MLVVHVQNVGAGGSVKSQPCNRAGVGFGQGLAPHERVHELSVMEILDSVAHGRTLYPYPYPPAIPGSAKDNSPVHGTGAV
jgi:hypothetical protein